LPNSRNPATLSVMNQNKNFQTLNEWQMLLLDEIRDEYTKGLLALNGLPSETVTFYGGAKIEKSSQSYLRTKELAKSFAQRGWGVVSGGGPGIMAASLEGARDGGGKAVAFKIDLPQESSAHVGDVDILFKHFSVRKYMLRQSNAFVFAPGGFGTLDELMEDLTLIVTKKHPKKPVFLLDSKFWQGYMDWFQKILLNERHTVNRDFFSLFNIVDTTEEVMKVLYG
jgi:uncharacterized protein (TIGR00730 family)